MLYTFNTQNGNLTATLSGQLTYTDNSVFKKILDHVGETAPSKVVLDFAKVDFIDSAGLGMLLLLRDQCTNKNIDISFKSVHGQVQTIFNISKFNELFTIQ
jgi:HptB-dependent secretion and biofilm anti anti-sigma factor